MVVKSSSTEWCEWSTVATVHGISWTLFHNRIRHQNMTAEEAATKPPSRQNARRENAVYTMYKGEKEVATGTIAELAKLRGVQERTMWFYTTTSGRKRALTFKKGLRLVLVEGGGEGEYDY